jgi:ribonuclease HIII
VLLADRYTLTLAPLVRSTGLSYVVCDKFGPAGRLKTRLAKLGPLELVQITHGERDAAVAAASILARAAYLAALERLSERFGLELRPGAGAPTVRTGRQFVAQCGGAALGQVAKLHFRTTVEILGRGG